MEHSEVQSRSLDLQTMEPVPIAHLEPSLPSQDRTYIKAVVTLIWPFSSSTQSAALLLAEPDFRLRRNKGQVRVQFVGSCGRAIAESRISSGDDVILGLGGAEWTKDQGALKTLGRNVDWELCFRRKLAIQIYREGQQLALLDVNDPTPSPEPQIQLFALPRPQSPLFVELTAPRPVATPDLVKAWSSPAYLKRQQAPESQLLRWPYDPFAEEDGYVEGIGRKRTKFWRASGEWRYLKRTPSPKRVKDGGVAQKAFEPIRDVLMESEAEPALSEAQVVLKGELASGNVDAQAPSRQTLHADDDVGPTEASILGTEEVLVDARESEPASTHDPLRSIAVTTEAAAALAVREPEATLKPPASPSNGGPQRMAEMVPSDIYADGEQVTHGGWDQATQQARFEAELFGGDTEENTEYDTSQGVELSSAADDGDATPKQGPTRSILFSHPPSLQQTNASMPSPSKLHTALHQDQLPLSATLRPVPSPSLPLVSPFTGPAPARLDRFSSPRDGEQQLPQQGQSVRHSPNGPESDEPKEHAGSEQKPYHAPTIIEQGKPQPGDPGRAPSDFGLDGAFFSRPGPDVSVPSPDEVDSWPVDHDTEELLMSANQQEDTGQSGATPHAVAPKPDTLSHERLGTANIGEVPNSPGAQKDIDQQSPAASLATPSTATTPAAEGDFSEEERPGPLSFPPPAAEDGNWRVQTSPPPPTAITSRLQIETFDEDPPHMMFSATDIRSFDVKVSRGGDVLKHQSPSPLQPINNPGEIETTTLPRDQLEPEFIDISSDHGLGSASEHDGAAAASLHEDEDQGSAYGEIVEDFDEEIDYTETEECDQEGYKRECYEYQQYMSPDESVTDTDERSSDDEEEEVRSTDLAEDVHYSEMDETEEEDSGNRLLASDVPDVQPYLPGKQVDHEVDANYSPHEPVISGTQQRVSATLANDDAIRAAAGADSHVDILVQNDDDTGGLERSPGVEYATEEAVSRQRSPVGDVGQEVDAIAGSITLDNAHAEKNAAGHINEGNLGEDSCKGDVVAKEHLQPRETKALASDLFTGEASGKIYLSGVGLREAYDSDEMASSERRQGISHCPSAIEDANKGITAMPPLEIVAGETDRDLKSRQEQEVQDVREVSRGRLDQEAALSDSETVNGLRRIPTGTVSHLPSVQEPENAVVKPEKSELAYVNERETEQLSISEGYVTLSETPGSSFEAPHVNPPAKAASPNAHSSGQQLVPSYMISELIEEMDLSQIPHPEPYRRLEYRSTISPVGTADESAAVSPQSIDQGAPIGTQDASHGVADVNSLPELRLPRIHNNETPKIVTDRPVQEDTMDIDRLGRSLSPSASAFPSSLSKKPHHSGQSEGEASVAVQSSGMSTSQRMASSDSKPTEVFERDLPAMAEAATAQIHQARLSTKEDAELPVSAIGEDITLTGEPVASVEKLLTKEAGSVKITHSSIQYPSFQQPIDLEKTPPSSPRQTQKIHEAASGEADIESSILTASGIIKRETLTSEVSSGQAPSSTAFLPLPLVSNHTSQLQEHEGDQSSATQPEAVLPVPHDSQYIGAQQRQLEKLTRAPRGHEQAAETPPLPEANAQHENEQVGPVDTSNDPTLSRATSSRRTSSRRISSRRTTLHGSMSIVADAISPWFEPRRSSRLPEQEATDNDNESVGGRQLTHDHTQRLAPKLPAVASESPTKTMHESDIPPSSTLDILIASDRGFRTPLSYYTPLNHLPQHLNTVPSPFGDATVDVLAVVADTSRPPERAKDGPRDYFTVFHVIDISVPAVLDPKHLDSEKTSAGNSQGFQVLVFRPWKASLPTAAPGDVVLLRNFVVKSIKGKTSLLSAEYSAWCVWRFGEDVAGHGRNRDGGTPIWARRQSQDNNAAERGEEECKGPPVEIGKEERAMVKQLRGWWKGLRHRQIEHD